jgi:hypothetical protein
VAAAVRLCSVLLRCRSGGVCAASGHGKLPAPDMRNYSALRAEVIQIHHRTVPPTTLPVRPLQHGRPTTIQLARAHHCPIALAACGASLPVPTTTYVRWPAGPARRRASASPPAGPHPHASRKPAGGRLARSRQGPCKDDKTRVGTDPKVHPAPCRVDCREQEGTHDPASARGPDAPRSTPRRCWSLPGKGGRCAGRLASRPARRHLLLLPNCRGPSCS